MPLSEYWTRNKPPSQQRLQCYSLSMILNVIYVAQAGLVLEQSECRLAGGLGSGDNHALVWHRAYGSRVSALLLRM